MARTPTPEELGVRPPPTSRQVVTFRLDDDEHAALLTLAKRANLGPSALARRIVEAYIAEHAPESKTPRNRGVRR